MKNYLTIAQIVVSCLLIGSILLQARGTGLGASFGGDGNVYRTKRGVEKVLFQATIVLAVAFVGLAIAIILLPKA
jgi:preprotein translocase subunit SecG